MRNFIRVQFVFLANTMRKRPKQQRSRQMVETLVEATALCIARHGLDGTTTPLIADIAGVSVGSLYQYFENKEELIEALVERIAGDVTRALNAGVRAGKEMPLEDLARVAIRVALTLLHSNAGLYLELVRNWYRLPTHKVADVLQHDFYGGALSEWRASADYGGRYCEWFDGDDYGVFAAKFRKQYRR